MTCDADTPTNRDNETCDRPIGRGSQHAQELALRALHEQLRGLGADVEDECAVPEQSTWWYKLDEWKSQEALLDLCVKWPGAWILGRLLHITVRDPEADRYQPEAQHRPETAAARATQERNARYPPTNGAYVERFAFEPLGRLGKEEVHVIEAMAADVETERRRCRLDGE